MVLTLRHSLFQQKVHLWDIPNKVSHYLTLVFLFTICYKRKEGFAVPYYFLKLSRWHKTQIHYGFLWPVPFSGTAISLESSMTKTVYLPSLMKAVNATSQALLGQLPALLRLSRGKLVDNGLLCWVCLHRFSCTFSSITASSQCPFSKWSDLYVRSSSDFLGSELLGTTECIFIVLRNVSDEISKVDF